MITLSIQASGFDAIQMQLDQFPANATRELSSALLEAGNTLTTIIQQMPPVNSLGGYGTLGIPVAPKYGGTLRQSVHATQTGNLTVEVGPDTDYADFVYFGTSKMPARPFLQWALENFGGTQAIEEIMQRTVENLVNL